MYGKMTDKEVKARYNSKEWKEKRLEILARDHYECVHCRERLKKASEEGKLLYGSDAKIRRAEEVHHIKEIKKFPDLWLDDDNLVSLCIQCHNIAHGRHPKRFIRKKNLVADERW